MTNAASHRPGNTVAGARWKRQLANWRAYALAGGASLAAGTNVDAQIVFSTVDQSTSGNAASSKLSFAVNGHAVVAFETHQRGFGGASYGTAVIGAKAGIKFYGNNGFGFNYAKGAVIGWGSSDLGVGVGLRSVQKAVGGSWTTHGNFGSIVGQHARAGSVEGYIGFKTDSGDKGWIKIKVGPSGNANAGVAIVVEAYAYDSTPGGSIHAGDMGAVPEPGTMALVLMAAGAAGLASIRRARARVAGEIVGEAEVAAS